ncbi:MAG: plastocyanin [Meiothermus sp.]
MRGLGFLALFLAACAPMTAASPPTTASPVAQVQVSLVDFEFKPQAFQIAPGTSVVFKNQGQAPHTVTDSAGRFDSGTLAPGAEFRYTFQTPGTYQIYCKIHPYMTLTLRVG